MSMQVSILLKIIEQAQPGSKTHKTLMNVKKAADQVTRSFARTVKAGMTMNNVQRAIDNTTKSIERNEQALNRARGKLLGAAALAASLALPVHSAVKFEEAMSDVAKVVDFDNAAQFRAMNSELLLMATRVPKTAQELAAITAQGGQTGIARGELLQFTEDAAKMQTAFDLTSEQAAQYMTGMRTIFGLNQKQVVMLGDAVNTLGNNFDARERQILDVIERAGAQGKQVGMTGKQVASLATAFIALKARTEVAGTAMNAMFAKLATAPKQGKKFQSSLRSLGYDATEFAERFKKDAQGTLVEFLEKVRGADDIQGILLDMFGLEYSDDLARLVEGLHIYKNAIKEVSDNNKIAGAMQEEYAKKAATTAANFKKLQGQMFRLSVTIGNILLPAVNSIMGQLGGAASAIANFAEKYPELTKWAVIAAASMMGLAVAVRLLSFVFLSLKGGFLALRMGLLMFTKFAIKAKLFAKVGAMIMFAAKAARVLALALLTNPIGLAITAIATAAYFVYKHWSTLKQFFIGFWNGIKSAWNSSVNWIKGLFDIDLYASGQKIIQSLIDGLMAKWNALKEKVAAMAQTVRNYWPFSPAKEGPLRDLNKIKLAETIASGIRPQPLTRAVNNLARKTMQPLRIAGASAAIAAAPAAAGQPGIASGTTININVSVVANTSDAKEIGKKIADQVRHSLNSSLHDGVNSR